MELIQRVQTFKRNLEASDDPSVPWYRRKRTFFLAGILAIILIGALIFVGGYFAGMKAEKEYENIEMISRESIVVPPLEWEGSCPKTSAECPTSYKGIPPLILVSLDAFHPDFMDRGFTPTIKNVAKCGTHTPYMFPVFPSKTFPNHFSQVTGVNPTSHGIIDNNMYDPIRRKLFKVGQPESLEPYWWLKEPIWVTAQKQGKKSGCFFWPGSEVKINGSYPTYYKKYNAKIPFNSRVDQILKWLDLPTDSRPQLLTLYVNEPDHTLHAFGTKAKQVDEALAKVDGMISRLFAGLQQRKLINCVNVIIMSDHGMSDVDCSRVVDVSQFINVGDTFSTMGPFGRIRPKGKRDPAVVTEMVSKLRCKSTSMRAYEKEQLPVRLHYADNPRVEPIFLDMDSGWTVVSKGGKPGDYICTGGAHGYDNLFPTMRAIFIAHGPSFKRNFTMRPFINTEIYEMLAELIDIAPNPNNGTRGSMHYIMTSPRLLQQKTSHKSPTIAEIPNDENVYSDRVAASTCSCPQPEVQTPVQDQTATQNLHFPFGFPDSDEDQNSFQLLYNEDYVISYSLKYKTPLWSAFTIKQQSDYKKVDAQCWIGDARISEETTRKCEDFTQLLESKPYVLQRPLYPLGFSSSSNPPSFFITNSVPKSLNHTKIIEESFNQMLKKWSLENGDLNVVIGPAYDYFATGIKPNNEDLKKRFDKSASLLVPTHIFVVVSWCSVKSNSLQACEHSKIESHAFLLPNEPYPITCESPDKVILKNAARIVDVEKLTGLSFFTDLPIYEAIRLRTAML